MSTLYYAFGYFDPEQIPQQVFGVKKKLLDLIDFYAVRLSKNAVN